MHAVCETAHANTDGYLCSLTDGVRRERVNLIEMLHCYHIIIPNQVDFKLSIAKM